MWKQLNCARGGTVMDTDYRNALHETANEVMNFWKCGLSTTESHIREDSLRTDVKCITVNQNSAGIYNKFIPQIDIQISRLDFEKCHFDHFHRPIWRNQFTVCA
jgi:hypothetical protein